MSSDTDAASLRWKMAVACDTCRRRKVRCDGETPCSRCSKSGSDCTFTRPKYLGQPKQSPPSPPPTKRRRCDTAGGCDPAVGQRPKEHLLLIDPDDQLVYEGPSSGIPLFARLGLLKTVELSESEKNATVFMSHSSGAFGIVGAVDASSDFYDLCLQQCSRENMIALVSQLLSSPVFFPLLHTQSFATEIVAVTQRRLKCTPQYGALLMSILAVSVRLAPGPDMPADVDRTGDRYFDFAQDLLRISQNQLDIRRILALYHLALATEGQERSAGVHASLVAEAIGLAFATGLHRDTSDFQMDPVTAQIRTRLFWALYRLDVALAYSHGRPALIRLEECSVDVPIVADNCYITKSAVLPQPPDSPAVDMAAAVKLLEIHVILGEILSAINAPTSTPLSRLLGSARTPCSRITRLEEASKRLRAAEATIPPYLTNAPPGRGTYLRSVTIRTCLLFARTLIARQDLIEVMEGEDLAQTRSASQKACQHAVESIKLYARLRHHRLLQGCDYSAVSHLTAASHTLIACMKHDPDLLLDHRPDLLTAIDLLGVLSLRFASAGTAAALLTDLSRAVSARQDGAALKETVAIKVLARRMAFSPPSQPAMATPEQLSTASEIAPSPDSQEHFNMAFSFLNDGFMGLEGALGIEGDPFHA